MVHGYSEISRSEELDEEVRKGEKGELTSSHQIYFSQVYGYHEGQRKVLVVSDLEMLNEILVKQFENFHARAVSLVRKWMRMLPLQRFPIQASKDGPKTHLVDVSSRSER